MADDLEERLKSHAQAFEGLMSLIPAKNYYGEDTSDQWRRKKQTKAEKKAAKKAKLDPENIQTAKDVMDENERKRKRQLEGLEDDDLSDPAAPGKEQPHQGLKLKESKRQKLEKAARHQNGDEEDYDDETARQKREERQKQIQERREKKKQKQKEKAEARKSAREQATSLDAPNPEGDESDGADDEKKPDTPKPSAEKAASEDDAADSDSGDDEIEAMDVSGLVDEDDDDDSNASDSDSGSAASASPDPESPASSAVPSASSSSSIVPPADTSDKSQQADKPQKSGKLKLPDVDSDVLQERLKARIEALRAARKADGIDGKPARNRQELMESRRRKEEERRQRKKEVRKQAKEDEQRKKAEAELARLRGSGSPGTPDIFSPREQENNFSFGRIAFDDGQQTDLLGTKLIDVTAKKGRMDPKTALIHAQKKKERLASMDEEKRKEIEEKERWLSAKKKVHGEKVRDDTNLLKKTLKRKDKQKKKSEKEWNERTEGVEKAKQARQKKREDNLQKRRETKGTKPGKKANRIKAASKKKSRPGFEGSFRSKNK
ncbi:surfeit locus protein 6-domain-containing protein [Phyllosticta paracitricarpa]|uniref:Ribosome biogenesis protein Rrp14-C n=1 Tax=Phyllosticta paracitricarpa TaxID=2016321 RepID=A0ABR1NH62_9PEZI